MTDIIPFSPSQKLIDEFPEISQITIYGTSEEPLFPVAQVQDAIGSGRIRLDMGGYKLDLDYVHLVCKRKDGKENEQNLLTEQGLYKVLMKTDTAISEKFQTFTKVVMRELRLRGQVTLNSALEKLKNLENELHDRDQKISQLDNQLEEEHVKTVTYQRESTKFYNQKMDAQTKLMAVQHRENQMNMWNKGSAEYQLQLMRERFYKKIYVYVEPIPKNLRNEIEPYSDDPHESDDIVLSVSYTQRTRDEISILYVPPKTTITVIHETLKAFSCGNKIYNMSVETLSDELARLE